MATTTDIVLITGINGYVGAHVALGLLQAGYHVRGAVRSLDKGERFREQAHFKPYSDRLTFVEVPDITMPGAYDNAVKDIAVAIHLASPVFLGGDYNSSILPAKQGTLTLLQSLLDKSCPQKFRQLVYFSSIAAVIDHTQPANYTFTEKDWSPLKDDELVRNMGVEELGNVAYFASKAISERVVWEFVQSHHPTWSTCVLNPAVCYGPIIHPVSSPSQLNMTIKPVWDLLSGTAKEIPGTLASGAYVDVRDVASITTYAVRHADKVANRRFVMVAGSAPLQAVADILRDMFPDRRDAIAVGEPGKGYRRDDWGFGSDAVFWFSSKVVEELTGTKWVRFEDSVRDTVKSFEDVFGRV